MLFFRARTINKSTYSSSVDVTFSLKMERSDEYEDILIELKQKYPCLNDIGSESYSNWARNRKQRMKLPKNLSLMRPI